MLAVSEVPPAKERTFRKTGFYQEFVSPGRLRQDIIFLLTSHFIPGPAPKIEKQVLLYMI